MQIIPYFCFDVRTYVQYYEAFMYDCLYSLETSEIEKNYASKQFLKI